jgi:hypothetical protein
MPTYKLQVQEDNARPDEWHDVLSESGECVFFSKESEARAALAARFPVLVRMEQLGADRKRTRVVVVNAYADIDEEKDA